MTLLWTHFRPCVLYLQDSWDNWSFIGHFPARFSMDAAPNIGVGRSVYSVFGYRYVLCNAMRVTLKIVSFPIPRPFIHGYNWWIEWAKPTPPLELATAKVHGFRQSKLCSPGTSALSFFFPNFLIFSSLRYYHAKDCLVFRRQLLSDKRFCFPVSFLCWHHRWRTCHTLTHRPLSVISFSWSASSWIHALFTPVFACFVVCRLGYYTTRAVCCLIRNCCIKTRKVAE